MTMRNWIIKIILKSHSKRRFEEFILAASNMISVGNKFDLLAEQDKGKNTVTYWDIIHFIT